MSVANDVCAAPVASKEHSPKGSRQVAVTVGEKLLWDTQDIVAVTGLSATTIVRFRNQGKFPEPVDLGIDRVCWRPQDIKNWLAQRVA